MLKVSTLIQASVGGPVTGSLTMEPAGVAVIAGGVPVQAEVLTSGRVKVLAGLPTLLITQVPLQTFQPTVAVPPAIDTSMPLKNLAMSAAPTVTTAGLAFDMPVMEALVPVKAKPPFHDHTPSAPLTMTVYLIWPRLANDVQCQSSLVKPDLTMLALSIFDSVLLTAARRLTGKP